MMSKSSYLTDFGDHNAPHIMFFQTDKNDATWGANVANAPVMSVNYWYLSAEAYPQLKSFPPMTVVLVMVDKWSDGTAGTEQVKRPTVSRRPHEKNQDH